MKFVVKHPTKNSFLTKPCFVGDSVRWTDREPVSERVLPWIFATRSGAEKARDMHALEASVEPWYEAGDTAESVRLSPSNISQWRGCPPHYSRDVTLTTQCNTAMQDYTLAVVLAELAIVSGDFGGC